MDPKAATPERRALNRWLADRHLSSERGLIDWNGKLISESCLLDLAERAVQLDREDQASCQQRAA